MSFVVYQLDVMMSSIKLSLLRKAGTHYCRIMKVKNMKRRRRRRICREKHKKKRKTKGHMGIDDIFRIYV